MSTCCRLSQATTFIHPIFFYMPSTTSAKVGLHNGMNKWARPRSYRYHNVGHHNVIIQVSSALKLLPPQRRFPQRFMQVSTASKLLPQRRYPHRYIQDNVSSSKWSRANRNTCTAHWCKKKRLYHFANVSAHYTWERHEAIITSCA